MRQRRNLLEIGGRVRLRDLDNPTAAYIVRVEDVSERWVAVQRPIRHYQPVRLYPGTAVEVSFVRTVPPEGIYRTETVVLGETRTAGVPLLRLQMPERWERKQLREYFRVAVVRPVRVRSLSGKGDEPWLEGYTRDLSGGGVQVVLPQLLERGQLLELELDLPHGTYRMRGTVQRAQREPSEEGFIAVAGIKFQDLPETEREEIIRYAFERQIELRKKGVT